MHAYRRIDATTEQLGAALDGLFVKAAESLIPVPPVIEPPRWRDLEEQAHLPEGVLSRTYQIDHRRIDFLAAWWCDAVGRKHWLLEVTPAQGFPPPGDAIAHRSWGPARTNEDHPLSHIAPPLSFLWRMRGEGREPFVVCRCGFAGTPESLGWMGASCGPCHDREQEGEPPLGLDPWRRDLGPFDHFVQAPDGRLVTLRFNTHTGQAGTPVVVRVWAPPYVGKPQWRREWSDSFNWAVAVNRRFVALLAARRLTLVNLDDGKTTDSRAMPELTGAASLAFAGLDGERLLALCGGRLQAWAVSADGKIGETLYRVAARDGQGEIHVSPMGRRVLIPDLSVRETATGDEIEQLRFEGRGWYCAAFAPDGAVIAHGRINLNSVNVWGLARWPVEQESERPGFWSWLVGRPPRKPAQLVQADWFADELIVSPDGQALAGHQNAHTTGTSCSTFTLASAQTMGLSARLSPGEIEIHRLGFTADGQLLVLSGRGLAVYPWRELAGVR